MSAEKKLVRANPPRQHHTVCRAYLDGFCIPDTDRIALLDLRSGEIRQQRPSKVMRRHDYFRQRHAPAGTDEFVFEREKSKRLEAQLKTIIGKLSKGGADLTEDEIIAFIQHIELQWLTVPKQAEFLKSMAKRSITRIALTIPDVAEYLRKGLGEIVMKDESRFTLLRDILSAGTYFRYISRMIWHIWEAPEKYFFITSDNPVIIFNLWLDPSKGAGIALTGSKLLYPLSPRHCLELSHPEASSGTSFDPLQPIERKPSENTMVCIRPAGIMPVDLAYSTNCLQGMHAERYLAGNDVRILEEIYESLKSDKPRSNRG